MSINSRPLLLAIFLLLIAGIQAVAGQDLEYDHSVWGDSPKTVAEAKKLYWRDTSLRAPLARSVELAQMVEDEGTRTQDKALRAQGLARKINANLRNGDWSLNPNKQMKIAADLVGTLGTTEKDRTVRAEFLLIRGFLNAIFLIPPDEGGLDQGLEDIHKGLIEAHNLQNNELLAIGYHFASSIERLKDIAGSGQLQMILQAEYFAKSHGDPLLTALIQGSILVAANEGGQRDSTYVLNLEKNLRIISESDERLERLRFILRHYGHFREVTNPKAEVEAFDIEKWRREQAEDASSEDNHYTDNDVNLYLAAATYVAYDRISRNEPKGMETLLDNIREVGEDVLPVRQAEQGLRLLHEYLFVQAPDTNQKAQEHLQLLLDSESLYMAYTLSNYMATATAARGDLEQMRFWLASSDSIFQDYQSSMLPMLHRTNNYVRLAFDVTRKNAADRDAARDEITRKALQHEAESHRLVQETQTAETRLLAIATVAALAVISILAVYAWSLARNQRILETKVKERTAGLQEAMSIADQATKERELLLGRVCHDLRNPVTVVMMCSEMLDTQDSHSREVSALLASSSTSMSYLTDQLLRYSEAQNSTRKWKRRSIHVKTLLERMKSSTILREAQSQNELNILCSPTAPEWIDIEDELLLEVINNLVNNSYRHTENGTIDVQYKATDSGTIRFSVCDTGRGMTKEIADNVFVPFFKGGESGTNNIGLGMTICRQAVEQMQGTISITSEKDCGTTVIVELPMQQVVAPDTAATKPTRTSHRILVVDDQHDVRASLGMKLREYGHEVLEADDQLDLASVTEFNPTLCLMDIAMPTRTGIELAREIRQHLSSDIPLIGMSASTSLRQNAEYANVFDEVHDKLAIIDKVRCAQLKPNVLRSSP